MGAVMQGGGSRRAGRRRTYRPMAEINVTPFVDVMLVLLIVFMVAAPLLTVGVPVDLPKTGAPNLPGQDEPLVVTIDNAGKVYLNETETTLDTLVAKLIAITQNNAEARIFVRGDRTIAYGQIMEVMGTVSNAGFKRVALVAELPQTGRRAR
jgi:biopolymer transport protein TolR